MTRRRAAIATAVATVALLLAGCGGADNAASSTDTGQPAPAESAATAALSVASTSLGDVLVDAEGRTVYLLTADSPGRSTCDASCLGAWPAVAAPASGTPTAGPAVTAELGTTAATDGTTMVTAGGWPLYTFVQDQGPGEVTGEGVASFGGTWYAVAPDGSPVEGKESGSGGRY